MARYFCFLLPLVAMGLLTGCSAYVSDYYYTPRPALAQAPPPVTQQQPPEAVLASVIGIRHADSKLGVPLSIHVRMRVDNTGPQPVIFDGQSLDLLNGELLKFNPPIVRPAGPISVAPGQSAVVDAYFPFPPGRSDDDTDLNSLQVRWVVQVLGTRLAQSVDFARIWPTYYYDPYYFPPFGVYGGVGFRGRWR